MPRPAIGQVLERRKDGYTVFAIRYRAGRERIYETVGRSNEGVTRQDAERLLRDKLDALRLGVWIHPNEREAQRHETEPTFEEYANAWLRRRRLEGLSAKTLSDFDWSLKHLLPFFGSARLRTITARTIEAYKTAKLEERAKIEAARELARQRGDRLPGRPLSDESINHSLRHLSQILEDAREVDEWIDSNPAASKRRRLKVTRTAKPTVQPEQLRSLLDASSGVGRALLALLAGAGLRIGEALALRWENVDRGTGTLYVVKSKTDAGIREVHLSPALRDELALWRHDSAHAAPTDYVLPTSTGRRQHESNLRRDVLRPGGCRRE